LNVYYDGGGMQVNTVSDLSVLEKEYPLLVAVNRAAQSKFHLKQKQSTRSQIFDIHV